MLKPSSLITVSLLFSLMVAGCPDSETPVDGGSPADGPTVPMDDASIQDRDSDGVCDLFEESRGLDPDNSDSDGDGFADGFELMERFDPLRSDIPERDLFVPMVESSGGAVDHLFEVEVRADGESFRATYAAPETDDPLGRTAADFISGIRANFALPGENVGFVDEPGGEFVDVSRRTVLGFEIGFVYGDRPSQNCIRAYPFDLFVKSSLGRLVYRSSRYLLLLPVGETTRTGTWCTPSRIICPTP